MFRVVEIGFQCRVLVQYKLQVIDRVAYRLQGQKTLSMVKTWSNSIHIQRISRSNHVRPFFFTTT